jgi:2-polyprenyl-3-methyl-5-hydroxy-6-metoxy-1,4-benzoquinol methylase
LNAPRLSAAHAASSNEQINLTGSSLPNPLVSLDGKCSRSIPGEEMKKDATFKWDNKEFVEFYRNSANVIMLERKRCIKILLEIIAIHFPNLSGLNILDLGCGDGVITKYIQEKSDDNNFHLIDASEEMLKKAKENLGSVNVSYQHQSFEDYIEKQSEDSKYDIVISANAIHHLDFVKKQDCLRKYTTS